MTSETVRVGIIGTGFGVSAMLPGFRLTPGAEVVALCSGRRERAEAAAREHGIPHAFDDYRAMLAEARLDLVCVVTPVATHAPMTLAAIEAGCHVLCEKPTALDAAEAREMYERAQAAGVLHMIDHELRFNPTRRRIAELLGAGYVGAVRYAYVRSVSGSRADPAQPFSWWSERARGGGALGAAASHQLDLLRWWLGEAVEVSGQLETFVRERPDPESGAPRAVDSDDQYSLIARFAGGAYAHLFTSYVAHHGGFNRIEIHGDTGSLVLDHDDRLWGRRLGEPEPTEHTVADPLFGAPGLQPSVYNVSFVHLARELVGAIREGRALREGATFLDGWRTQQLLDAARRSWDERRWVAVEA
jgi:predicted dehydrogenase